MPTLMYFYNFKTAKFKQIYEFYLCSDNIVQSSFGSNSSGQIKQTLPTLHWNNKPVGFSTPTTTSQSKDHIKT